MTRVPADRSPTLAVQIGWGHTLLVGFLFVTSLVAAAAAAMLPRTLYWTHQVAGAKELHLSLWVGVASATALIATITFWRLGRLQPGTRGRARLFTLAGFATLFVGSVLVCALGLAPLVTESHINPFQKQVDWPTIFALVGSVSLRPLLLTATALAGISLLVVASATWSCWFLISPHARRTLWLMFDLLLASTLAGALVTEWLLGAGLLQLLFQYERVAPVRAGPILLAIALLVLGIGRWPRCAPVTRWLGQTALLGLSLSAPFLADLSVPEDDPEKVASAAVLLAMIALLLVRAQSRWLPIVADGIERIGIEALVAARHLRSKKSDYLTTIGIISIVAIMTACATLTLVLSVMGGFRNDLKQKIIGNSADVVVDADGDTFAGWEPLLERVRTTPGVTGASPFVNGEVMVTSATNLAGAVLRGIDPEAVRSVIELESNLTQGRLDYLESPKLLLDLPPEETLGTLPLEVPWLEDRPDPEKREREPAVEPLAVPDFDDLLDPTRSHEDALGDLPLIPAAPPKKVLPGIIVGRELARSLRLFLGDEVNVISPFGTLGPQGPMPKSRPFRVAGIFYSGMYEYDMKHVYVLLEDAQRFLNTENEITGIELKAASIHEAPRVADALRDMLKGLPTEDLRAAGAELRVQDWRQLNQNLFGALELERLSMFILLGFAILTAGFCVFATVTLMVQEKRPQVGILLAMGTKARTIVFIFLLEGLLLGALGSGFGLGLGYLLCFSTEHFGLRMDPEVYYIDRLPVHLDPYEFALVGVAALVICVLSTVFPATVASRLRPVDAMRYD